MLPSNLQNLALLANAAATGLIPYFGNIPSLGLVENLYIPDLTLLPGMNRIPSLSILHADLLRAPRMWELIFFSHSTLVAFAD